MSSSLLSGQIWKRVFLLIFVNADKSPCSVDAVVISGTDRRCFTYFLICASQSRGHMQELVYSRNLCTVYLCSWVSREASESRKAVAAGPCQGQEQRKGTGVRHSLSSQQLPVHRARGDLQPLGVQALPFSHGIKTVEMKWAPQTGRCPTPPSHRPLGTSSRG